MTPHDHLSLVEQGLAVLYRGRLIPIIRGGSGEDEEPEDLFAEVPADLSEVDDDALGALIDGYQARVQEIAEDHTQFVSDELTVELLLDATREAVATLEALRAEKATRDAAAATTTVADEQTAAELAALAARAADDEPDETPEGDEKPDDDEPEDKPVEEAATTTSTVVASAKVVPVRRARVPRPSASHKPVETRQETVALTAAGGAIGMNPGDEFGSPEDIAEAMIRRNTQFGGLSGIIPDNVRGEKYPIAQSSWSHLYGDDRRLGMDEVRNLDLVAAATDEATIRRNFELRRHKQLENPSLVASGGLCAPVTPYYQLQMISVADRPVRAALPAFNADRGGIRYARPASLASISTAVGTRTAANDFAGGTEGAKSCQIVDCPPFSETDVEIIYHCLQFGNLGARTFPERVTQWNNLVLSEHARTCESLLLTGIDTASTQVTAASTGLGATSDLLGQVLVAAAAMRNRHRMADDAILRAMFPLWSLDLMVSDVIRSQFQRFETDQQRIEALLRRANIEPSFYKDGASGQSQVFDVQHAGGLLAFPTHVNWFLFPEGSFIYLDGGVLELGIVRDSVLNKSNDFQIFGESFENVAFVGVESLSIVSTVCDSGVVAAPAARACPIVY